MLGTCLGGLCGDIEGFIGLSVDGDLLPQGSVGQIVGQCCSEFDQFVGRNDPHLVRAGHGLHEGLISDHPRDAWRLVFDHIDLVEWTEGVFDGCIGA